MFSPFSALALGISSTFLGTLVLHSFPPPLSQNVSTKTPMAMNFQVLCVRSRNYRRVQRSVPPPDTLTDTSPGGGDRAGRRHSNAERLGKYILVVHRE
ncbi:hypothetical protein BDY19DRAFT_74558 [Irpex rosettiformis]|uniref:Uncharacterized protein n=1 Tax=Irpex rosettiformis TaxID=378272 RepID=A0ACB8ULK2_9APHY|nr:hypothetical protein BDY19DRAFT_74558 [Irpex rosettiformis]